MSTAREIVVRADASFEIGSGHVVRCLALAQQLVKRGDRVRFLCRPLAGNLSADIEARGFPVSRIGDAVAVSEDQDRKDSAAALPDSIIDWLIVDHYGLGRSWESAMRPHARKIMVIDDLGTDDHDCDLLLNQNLYTDPSALYRKTAAGGARCLIGPRFALLRSGFSEIPPRDRLGPVRRILVFFGAADLPNATERTVRAIALLSRKDLAVDVVVGALHARKQELVDLCSTLPGFRIRHDADMVALMAGADLAVGAGGTTTWERCAAGLPTLAWAIADNQVPVLAELSKAGAVYSPAPESVSTPEGIARHLQTLLDDPAMRTSLAKRAREICDGRGVARVTAAMDAAGLSVDVSSDADCRLMYEWRNDPVVRAASSQTAPILWDDHVRWFAASRAREDRILLTGRIDDCPVGIVRFDRVGSDAAEISIYLDPAKIGHGLGPALLAAGEAWVMRHWPVRRFLATVKRGNIPSERLFQNAGYRWNSSAYEKMCVQ